MRGLIAIIVFSLCFLEVVKAGCVIPTDIDCPPVGSVDLADPYDCTQFYLCSNGFLAFPDPLSCGDGSYFDDDVDVMDCVPNEGNNTCVNECYVKKFCSLNDCRDPTVVDYPDSESCSDYYVCDIQGNPLPASCSGSDRYFDGEGCTDDASQCCSETQCAPYCSESDFALTLVADPCDCIGYYVCETEGSVPVITGTCDAGQRFNEDINDCEDGILCTPTCTSQLCSTMHNTLESSIFHH